MSHYRKKPVVIQAIRWAAMGDHPAVTRYADTVSVVRHDICPQCKAALIDHGLCPTLEGSHIVCPGDWIIRGVKGEFYPCKPDIFAATYEPAEALPSPPRGPSEEAKEILAALERLGEEWEWWRKEAAGYAAGDPQLSMNEHDARFDLAFGAMLHDLQRDFGAGGGT